MKAAGVTGVIVKLGGSNYGPGLYLEGDNEPGHQANARAVFGTCGHYWANGQTGSPEQIAAKIVGSGLVLADELVGWDLESWPNEARIWTPAEVVARCKALDAAGIPFRRQFVYLSLKDLKGADWRPVAALGVMLWLAAWDAGPALARHWKRAGLMLRQTTSGSNAAIRKVYDADLDLNAPPEDVWTVEELQTVLGIPADNDYGPRTEAAVKVWQGSHGLKVDGDAGPRTLSTMTRPIL